MDVAARVLMLFPAFMVGAAFGILLVLVLAGSEGLKNFRPIVFSLAGSLFGLVVFWLTERWWPPVIGPFICCPGIAAAGALLARWKS